MAIETFERREIKFLLSGEQYRSLKEFLPEYMESDPYCKDDKTYGIYNVYYDTDNDDLIRQSIEKPYYKEKVRLRSYMSPASCEDKVFLEIKKKIGGIVNKRRVAMTLEEAIRYTKLGVHPPDNGKYLRQQVLKELDVLFDRYSLYPKQYISYERAAYFGKNDRQFRLTFDRNITARRYDLTLEKESYGEQLIPDGYRLMEVKISDSMPVWLAEQLAALKIYKISFSKYGTAYKNEILRNLTKRSILSYV
ncbi:MAG: polyphosphate polymerase domain-containing protein [Ruminococcus sp.]|nr:polyphosphate polymerase domain-containing protein [Ruminococcus sp.]